MKAIPPIKRGEYATIRQLEGYCYRVLKPLLALMGVGLLLCFTISLMMVGVPLLVLSAAMMLGLFIWMIRLQQQPRRDVRCPYCTNVNSVFESVSEFDCDICERPIRFNESGRPMPADGSLDNTTPTSIYD